MHALSTYKVTLESTYSSVRKVWSNLYHRAKKHARNKSCQANNGSQKKSDHPPVKKENLVMKGEALSGVYLSNIKLEMGMGSLPLPLGMTVFSEVYTKKILVLRYE